jgi:hypothetical protein
MGRAGTRMSLDQAGFAGLDDWRGVAGGTRSSDGGETSTTRSNRVAIVRRSSHRLPGAAGLIAHTERAVELTK